MKISFCTTCMGYINYLKQTYLKNLQVGENYNCDFVLVNYNSQDGMDKWVNDTLIYHIVSGYLNYYHTKEPKEFNMSKAKNMAHKLGTGDILVNLDADNFLTKKYIEWLLNIFSNRNDVVTMGNGHGCGGRVAVKREDFNFVGGYDESLNRPSTGIDHHNFCGSVKDRLNKEIIITPKELCPFLEQTNEEKLKLQNITRLDRMKHGNNNR